VTPDAAHFGGRLPRAEAVGLLVVDVTGGFTDPTSPLACAADGAVEAIAELLEVARGAGIPVAFTRVAFVDGEQSRAAELFRAKVPALAVLRDGAPWAAIDPRVGPREGELVLRKELASAFAGTSLDAWVAEQGLDTLVIAGLSTSGCVRATVVDALQRGIAAIVPRQAVADRDPEAHAASLRDIDGRYGDVVELERALELLRGPVGIARGGAR
jgi:nicotinamidase-related amidase